uniref:Uncharacterized protein n=1 Tax=Brassica campestris TaxID=3711 RepID=M4E5P5_BRACM
MSIREAVHVGQLNQPIKIPRRSKRSDGGLPQKTLPSPAQPPSENQRTAAEEQRRNEKIVRFTELSRGICTSSKGMKDRPIRCMTSSGTSEGRGDQKESGCLVLRQRSAMGEKKLADRVSEEQVKRIELMVSDVDARDTKDEVFEEAIDSSKPESFQADDGLHEDLPSEEVKVPEVNGESHGEANLQHITTGEAVPGFVTSQMNGDEGEAGAGNVSETATLSFSENGIVSPEKKAVLLSFGSEKEEKKLGDNRIIHDQVENNILLVSDVDARDTEDEVFEEAIDSSKPESFQADDGLHEDFPSEEVKVPEVNGESHAFWSTPEHSTDDLEEENSNDKEVKDSKVSGETHGEANLQHITEGEAAPGFVTSKMNGDEGESGAENANEKVTCSFPENGIISPEKKQLVAEVIEETRNDGTEEENKEENVDVSAGMETEQEAGKREGADKDCFENESGAQRNGETVAEYTTVKYASGDSIQVASGEKSLNDSIEVACAGTSSPLELMTRSSRKPISSPRSRLLSFCQLLRWELLVGGDCIFHIIGIAHDKSSWLLDDEQDSPVRSS